MSEGILGVLEAFIKELKFNPNHVAHGEHGGEFTSGNNENYGNVVGKFTTEPHVSTDNRLTASDIEKIKPEQFYKYEYRSKLNNDWKDFKNTDSPIKLFRSGYHIRLKKLYRYIP